MNILHFSYFDTVGGAAKATYQLHDLLRSAGHNSILAVKHKYSNGNDVVKIGVKSLWKSGWPERIERISARMAGVNSVKAYNGYMFNNNYALVPDLSMLKTAIPEPDVVFIHWISGMLTVADIKRLYKTFSCQLIWILLDMEPITGGCHYAGNCERYMSMCKKCPQLESDTNCDWARRTWKAKSRDLSGLPITFVAPTKWLYSKLLQSPLSRDHSIKEIQLPISPKMLPGKQSSARQHLGLPLDQKIIMAGSLNLHESRKGMCEFVKALQLLAEKTKAHNFQQLNHAPLVVLIGDEDESLRERIPFPVKFISHISSIEELAQAYRSADLFASPSIEDAGPVMLSQAMLCGVPVVAFRTGIASELINKNNGYIAEIGDVEGFCIGIKLLLEQNHVIGMNAAHTSACHHERKKITKKYEELISSH